jgi:hypothetical protein
MQKAGLRRKIESILFLLLVDLSLNPEICAQKPANPPPNALAAQKKTESFWDKVLRYAGVSHDASNLKAPGDEVVSGQIWVANVSAKTGRKVTVGGGYRSPIFVPGGKAIVALKGADLVRVGVSGGNAVKRYTVEDVTKLVGFSVDDPDTILVLTGGSGDRPGVGLLLLSSGKITAMPYDPKSKRDLEMIERMQSWERVYSDKKVYTKRQTKDTRYGPVEWTDVFLKTQSEDAVDVSECDGVNCGQPSLSADGRFVVFVKTEGN